MKSLLLLALLGSRYPPQKVPNPVDLMCPEVCVAYQAMKTCNGQEYPPQVSTPCDPNPTWVDVCVAVKRKCQGAP